MARMFFRRLRQETGAAQTPPGCMPLLLLFTVTGLAVPGVCAAAGGPNLITNFGFEASSSETITPTGWTNIGRENGVIPYANFPQQPVYQGKNFYDLGGYGDPGGGIGYGIKQTVATVPRTAYTLKFGLSGENASTSIETLTVSIGSQKTNFPVIPTTTGEFSKPFTTQTIHYVATGAATTISFVTTAATAGTGSNDPLIDGIIFSAGTGPIPTIALARKNLTTVTATGTPAGGTFALSSSVIAGSANIAKASFAKGTTARTNPATIMLADPDNPSSNGAPTAGGLGSFKLDYAVAGNSVSATSQVPTFGMSCYSTPLESDWGSLIVPVWGGPPTSCTPVKINNVVYTTATTNPNGLTGTYCTAFLVEVKMQGAGTLNNGTDISYNPSTQLFSVVSSITGHDGTPLVPGKTVARDLNIIPNTGVTLDLNNIGTGILANDAGPTIKGYRLALYEGAGNAVCNHFNNQIVIGACQPAQPNCPGSALK